MKKQTAVEWMVNGLLISNYISKDSKIMNEFIEKAKEMEKKQMIDFADNVRYDAEKYYNQIYTDGTI